MNESQSSEATHKVKLIGGDCDQQVLDLLIEQTKCYRYTEPNGKLRESLYKFISTTADGFSFELFSESWV